MTEPRRSLLHHRDFVQLWTGQTISQFGSQVSALAIPLIAATVLQVTPFEFGLLSTIEFLPFILLSLPAGVWIDRMRRRPILIAGDLGRALILVSIPVAFYFNVLTIWQLYVVGFVTGCLTVFFDVSYQSYLPAVVDRDALVEGNSKLESTRAAAQVVGPGIAGVLIGTIGAATSILVNSVSFVVSALFVLRIRRVESDPRLDHTGEVRVAGPGMRREIAEGLRYVLGNPYLRSIAGGTGSSNLFGNIVQAIFILYMTREIGLSAAEIGLIFAVGSLGFLAGALIANRVAAWIGVGWAIVASLAVNGPTVLLLAIAPKGLEVAFFIVSGLLGGLATAVYNINQVSFRQAITPERMQGRMNATMRFIVWGTIPIGALLGGFLGGVIGLHETIWIGAIGSFVPVFFVLLSPVRGIREMPTQAEEPQPA